MSKLIVDSSAWIEYFAGSERGGHVREHLTRKETAVFITGFIAAEVAMKFLKEGRTSEEAIDPLRTLAALAPFDLRTAQETAELYIQQRKLKPKFGLADAHVLATAQALGADVLTCDHDFTGLPNATVIK
jgi:predicted nucleic acid-binding protein